MTHQNDDNAPNYDDTDAADASYEKAVSAESDKSATPGAPTFDAGLATLRQELIEMTGDDPEDLGS